jgi:hypothetical protein
MLVLFSFAEKDREAPPPPNSSSSSSSPSHRSPWQSIFIEVLPNMVEVLSLLTETDDVDATGSLDQLLAAVALAAELLLLLVVLE